MLGSFMLRLDHRSSGRASASCHLSARDDGRWDICWKLVTILSRHHSGWVGQSQPLGMCYRAIKLEEPLNQSQMLCRTPLSALKHLFTLSYTREVFQKVTWEFVLGSRIYTSHHTFGLSLILLFLKIAFKSVGKIVLRRIYWTISVFPHLLLKWGEVLRTSRRPWSMKRYCVLIKCNLIKPTLCSN